MGTIVAGGIGTTLGILAGRFKRQWLKHGANAQIARRALALYEEGMTEAMAVPDTGQVFYNGVNVAYLKFALRDPDSEAVANQILKVCEAAPRDYWSEASRAECLLLLERYPEALAAYRSAQALPHAERHWTSTGQQALDIYERQGRPAAGSNIAGLFQGLQRDYATG